MVFYTEVLVLVLEETTKYLYSYSKQNQILVLVLVLEFVVLVLVLVLEVEVLGYISVNKTYKSTECRNRPPVISAVLRITASTSRSIDSSV